MRQGDKIKEIAKLLEEAGHIAGEIRLFSPDGEARSFEIEIPVVLITSGGAKGGAEIRLVADDQETLLEEALSLVELLVGLDPDDRHGYAKEKPKRREAPKLRKIEADAFPLGGHVLDRFVIEPGERDLILALREGRVLEEIEERLLARVNNALDPGGDFTFDYQEGEIEVAREKALRAGLTGSDRSAWLFAFGEFSRQSAASHYFLKAAALAFSRPLEFRPIKELDLAPEIAEALVGKPNDSTLLIACLLSDLYISKLRP